MVSFRTRRAARWPAILLAALVGVVAQSGAAGAQARRTAPVRAVRAEVAPVIDGRDDDPVWRAAAPTSDFRQYLPQQDGEPTFRTEFKVAYDQRNLYVFVRAFDPHPDSLIHAVTRRDASSSSDILGFIVDSYDDHRTGFEFAVNPDGVKHDWLVYSDSTEDVSWDGVWDVVSRVDSLGWTAEFRIPFSQLRYPNISEHSFGFAAWRHIERYKENVFWPMFRPNQGLASQLGRVDGIAGIATPHALEVAPYALTKNLSRQTGSTFNRVQQASAGGDLKYGVSSNVVLDATINPDFGQVEADPSVVNLTAFETFFPERRPFFIEGTGLYRFGLNCNPGGCNNEGLFYSRRIGRSPQLLGVYGDPSSATSTPIAAAMKVTGRTAGGLNVGIFDAVTERVDAGGPEHRSLEPRTNYLVMRAQQELSNGRSAIGAIVTAVDRSLDQWTVDRLRRRALVGGTDFRSRFSGGRFEISGSASVSRVEGSAAAVALTQRDPAHYYQRAGSGLTFDPSRTSLGGDAEELRVGKYAGGVVRFQSSFQRQSAGYEVNDIGFLQRADEQTWSSTVSLNFRTPRLFYRNALFALDQWNTWTTAGTPLRLQNAVSVSSSVTLRDNSLVQARMALDQLPGTFGDRSARGGPALRMSTRLTQTLSFKGDNRRLVAPGAAVTLVRGDDGRSRFVSFAPALDLRISPRVQASVGAFISDNRDETQWYGNFSDPAGATHYSFAHLDQRTVSFTARASFAATPNLSIEVYGAPFVSDGRYSAVRQLSATPGANDYDARFAPYAAPAGAPSGFTVRQLRSDAVIRWEYRPGSTIFVVWTQGRDRTDTRSGMLSPDAAYSELGGLYPNNTFLVKAVYWFELLRKVGSSGTGREGPRTAGASPVNRDAQR